MPRVVIAAGGTAGHVVPALAVADALRAEGATVSFLGTRERARGRARPRGRLRDRLPARPRARPPQPAEGGAAPSARAAARRPRRAQGAARARAPTRSWAAAATSPGPAGLAALRGAPAAGPDRGRQPPRPRQPHARAPRAPRLPRLPDPRPRGRALPDHRPPGPAQRSSTPTAPPPARASGSPGRHAASPSSAAAWARARSTRRRSTAFGGDGAGDRAAPGPPHRGHAATTRAASAGSRARAARALHAARVRARTSATSLAACDLVLARAGGSVFEIAAAGRPAILVPYPHATADHQSANAALDGGAPAPRS